MPRWLASGVFKLVFTPDRENDKVTRQIRSSAGIAAFVGRRADAASWIEVGRCYQRFALQATSMGIRNAFVNQASEVPALRGPLASLIGTPGRRPDLVVRFGRGPLMPPSLRRPLDAVVI